MKRYVVYDTTGNPVGVPFNKWKDADVYRIVYNRPDWTIKQVTIHTDRKSTARQRAAVKFVEQWCDTTFEGFLDDYYEVSDFLADHLDTAKEIANDATASYLSMIDIK